MSVLVNFKICDNAPECGGVAVCPTGAFTYDEENKTIVLNNDKCISCGLCENECPIGAIRVAKTDEEYEKISKEIENDPRTTKDLFVDRYGASPLSEFFIIEANDVDNKIKDKNIVLIECYDSEATECLLKSIPIKELTKSLPKDTLYYKVCSNKELEKRYDIQELPAILIFKENNLLGKISDYYTNEEKEQLISEINEILS